MPAPGQPPAIPAGTVLLDDPRVAAIPVRECHEPLVDARRQARLLVSALKADPAGWHAHVRQTLLRALLAADAQLAGQGMRLVLVEGYRPPELQRRYWQTYTAGLAGQFPQLNEQQLRSAASRYVAPPEVAPHSTGGAADVALADARGVLLDMGTRINATPEESAGACFTWAPNIPQPARDRRVALARALSAQGLFNYATEWWHWSIGDRLHALHNQLPHAAYGPVEAAAVH